MEYHAPGSVAEACALLNDHSCHVLAGGTDLLVQMQTRLRQPERVIDIKSLPGTTAVTLDDTGLTIGAAAPAQSITERADISALYPGLVEAIDLIGSTQIQGRASVGGNLCNASPAADSVPALIANKAICQIAGNSGSREVSVEHFTTGPGSNCLNADEFLHSLFVPKPAAGSADAYLRFIPRTEMDIAVAGVGVSLTLDKDNQCTSARIVIGAVAPTALLVENAAQALVGTGLNDTDIAAAASAAVAASSPISDKRGSADYRRKLIAVLARRAITAAADRIRSTL